MIECACGQIILYGGSCAVCSRKTAKVRNKAGRDHRRHVRLTGVQFCLKVESADCGVCLRPLTVEPYPHPMSTTIGHEPPLAIAARDGWLTVIERPEHLVCNVHKGTLTDAQHVGTVSNYAIT